MTCKIGDLCEQIRGVTYSKADAVTSPALGYKPVLRANSITDRGLYYGGLVYVPEDKILPRQYVKAGDVVIAASSGSLDVVGKAARALSDFDGGFGAFCKVLRPNKKVDAGYFAHFFQTRSYRQKVSSLAAGANINNLRNEHLDDLEITLPSLPEQRRIAAILDKADALRAKRREAIAKLDQLLQSVFLDMFGDPVSNPKKWRASSLKEAKAVVQTGPFGSLLHKEDYISGGIPLINPMHIVAGAVRPGVGQTVSTEKAAELENYRLRAGDVVMGRRGEMGRCAVVSRSTAGMLCGTGSLLIRPEATSLISVFLATLLSNGSMKRHLESLSQGVTMANLNSSMIEGLKIILPPTDLQLQFSRARAGVDEQMRALQRAAAQTDTLFTSLQHRAFSGQLA